MLVQLCTSHAFNLQGFLYRVHARPHSLSLGSAASPEARHVVNIGPLLIASGVLAPFACLHGVEAPKPRVLRGLDNARLSRLEFVRLMDDLWSFLGKCNRIDVYQLQASLFCRQGFAASGLLLPPAASAGF